MLKAFQQPMQQAVQAEENGRMVIESAERQNLARLDIDAQKSGGPKESLVRMHAAQTPSRGGGGSPAADQQTPQAGSTGGRRGAVCYYHKRGLCKYGANCRYVHDTTDPGTMVLIRGLPYSTSEQEIVQFLSPNAIQSVTLVRSAEGQFNGTAFVEMESPVAASLVIKNLDCKFFTKDRYVLIFPSSRREREEAMANPLPFPYTPGPPRRSDGLPGPPPVATAASGARARSGGRMGPHPGSASSRTPQSASPQPQVTPVTRRLPPPVPPPVVLQSLESTERAPPPTESEAELYTALLRHQQSIINQQSEQLQLQQLQLGAIARVGTPGMHTMGTGFHTARAGFHTDPGLSCKTVPFASPPLASPMGVCAPPALSEPPLQQHTRLAPPVAHGLYGVPPPVLPSPGPKPYCSKTGVAEDKVGVRRSLFDDESPSRGAAGLSPSPNDIAALRRLQAEGFDLRQLLLSDQNTAIHGGTGQAQGAPLRMRSSNREPTPPFRCGGAMEQQAPGPYAVFCDEVADDPPPALLAA